MAVPANMFVTLTFQDNRGFKSLTRMELFLPDISSYSTFAQASIATVYLAVAQATTSVAATAAAMSNAKLVKVSFGFDFDYAQEPSSETGTYQLVIQKAALRFNDGNGGSSRLEIPAPKDALFLSTGTDNLIVVNFASTLLTNFQGAFTSAITQPLVAAGTTTIAGTARGGIYASQFDGGQLVQAKPRRRRVVQGA
jgi:hypothetical protein